MSGLSDLLPASFGLGFGVRGTLQPGTRVQIQDDNSGSGSLPVLSYAEATPRTHMWAMLRTGHIFLWGSSDFGAGAGGNNAIGFDSTHPVPWTIITGTTATGHVGTAPGGGVAYNVFSATSHRRIYDAVFMIPVLSTGAQQFRARHGFANVAFGALTNATYLEIDSSTSPNAQFITTAAGVSTQTDTGVAIVAGTYYRVRIQVDNAGPANCWIVTDTTPLGAPTVTNGTNIPNGTGQGTFPNFLVESLVGTTSKSLTILYAWSGMDRYAA